MPPLGDGIDSLWMLVGGFHPRLAYPLILPSVHMCAYTVAATWGIIVVGVTCVTCGYLTMVYRGKQWGGGGPGSGAHRQGGVQTRGLGGAGGF